MKNILELYCEQIDITPKYKVTAVFDNEIVKVGQIITLDCIRRVVALGHRVIINPRGRE